MTEKDRTRWKEQYLDNLEELAGKFPAVAQRRDQLLLVAGLIDRALGGWVMDAIIQGQGYLNSISDCSSASIGFVSSQGTWCLGFEGDGGELVIAIDYIASLKPRKTGVEIHLESGETIYLRFHGRATGPPAGTGSLWARGAGAGPPP